ncbi:hypothetical protein Nepgr_009410 [Nepenthes gracilis]|uniref:Uncharacterized protein n=1 Tax=Nepenthes gracilis TaxID=150966 RepID=A0AAD3SAZ4_NEPGR|nr:hypothetical protein Nepgr_009410 [Nepenthes gracilis]
MRLGNLALPAQTVERLQDVADSSGSFAACMMRGLQMNGVEVPGSGDLALHCEDQSSCPSMGKLKRNLEVIRKQLNASRSCDMEDYSISLAEQYLGSGVPLPGPGMGMSLLAKLVLPLTRFRYGTPVDLDEVALMGKPAPSLKSSQSPPGLLFCWDGFFGKKSVLAGLHLPDLLHS